MEDLWLQLMNNRDRGCIIIKHFLSHFKFMYLYIVKHAYSNVTKADAGVQR